MKESLALCSSASNIRECSKARTIDPGRASHFQRVCPPAGTCRTYSAEPADKLRLPKNGHFGGGLFDFDLLTCEAGLLE